MWPCQVNITDVETGGKLHSSVYFSPDIEFDPAAERLSISEGTKTEEFARVKLHSIDNVGVTLSALVPPMSGHGFAPDEVYVRLDWATE
jgi:hypothetical protein